MKNIFKSLFKKVKSSDNKTEQSQKEIINSDYENIKKIENTPLISEEKTNKKIYEAPQIKPKTIKPTIKKEKTEESKTYNAPQIKPKKIKPTIKKEETT